MENIDEIFTLVLEGVERDEVEAYHLSKESALRHLEEYAEKHGYTKVEGAENVYEKGLANIYIDNHKICKDYDA